MSHHPLLPLYATVYDGDLDWQIITDRPSELPTGWVYLNHERVIALLDELHGEDSDPDYPWLPERDFNDYLRGLGAEGAFTPSEYCIESTGEPVWRRSWRIRLSLLNALVDALLPALLEVS